MSSTLKFLTISLLTAFLSVSATAQNQFSLTYKYTKGKIDRYQSATTYSSKQIMGDQEINVTGSAKSISRLETESTLPDGGASILYSLEEMIIGVKTMGMDTTMNQKDLIGKRSRIILNRFGKELSSEALDSLDVVGLNIGVDFGASTQQTFILLPENPVKIGDNWKGKLTDTTNIGEGQMITKSDYQYVLAGKEKKNNHDCLRLTYEASIDLAGKMTNMGMEMFIEGSGTVEGTVWFDATLGKIIADETNSGMDISIALTGPMQMTIPSIVSVKSSRNLLE